MKKKKLIDVQNLPDIANLIGAGVVDSDVVESALKNGFERLNKLSVDGDVKDYAVLLGALCKVSKLWQDELKRNSSTIKLHANTDIPGITVSSIATRLGIGVVDKSSGED